MRDACDRVEICGALVSILRFEEVGEAVTKLARIPYFF